MNQAKFQDGKSIGTVQEWVNAHYEDYTHVEKRLESVRNIVLYGPLEYASSILKKAYLFGVMSIQTEKDRHERAFTAYLAGNKPLKQACLDTVYGGQKYGWIDTTFQNVDFENLAIAVRYHHEEGSYANLLDIIDTHLKGVSHRKGAFMLAMSGLHEFMCIDSNVANHAENDVKVEFDSAKEYMNSCRLIALDVMGGNTEFPPFIIQWAIYDFQRGEHSRHMAFFREVLP